MGESFRRSTALFVVSPLHDLGWREYPASWPASSKKGQHPPGTAPFTADVETAIQRQKQKIKTMLADTSLTNFPREEVKQVLDFWRISL